MIKLKILLEQIIKEYGDLDKIPVYPHQNNKFTTDEGWNVEVKFDEWDEEYLKAININTEIYKPPVYNVSYAVEGIETQFTKSTYGSLIKILKTVVDICEDFIKEQKPNGLILFAANRNEDKILSITDPSKTKLYHAIAIKYIFKNLPNYTLVDISNFKGFDGFMIYNKEKINK
mgnify:FL=1